ncbi:MAG: phosphoribosylformylglycinamidine cyclo-ligase [Candidatus Omnitrophica bacterium]|nr:phosphoribosylformylglycinamidine cyclo-ligase [Candidatus Omnitrophota bacterium]
MTYRSAGVDIDAANTLVKDYKRFARRTHIKGIVSDIGSFGGLFRPDLKRYRDPILVSSTDGVGTKLKIAFLADKHDTVGIDLVAMSVNDCLCTGAEGLFFLDYIATGKLRPSVLRDVVKGISAGCREAGYALIGGETAEMPGMYAEGEYDLAGFAVGAIDRLDVIDGRAINPGDIVVGIESSGLHSNGYSLVRRVFSKKELKRYAGELLKPTRIYCKAVLAAKKALRIKGVAHITGGAFLDKIPRIIPRGMAIEIHKVLWKVPWIFTLIKERAKLDDREMYRTLNMGIGMVLVIGKKDVDKAQRIILKNGFKSHVIGKVVKGNGQVVLK